MNAEPMAQALRPLQPTPDHFNVLPRLASLKSEIATGRAWCPKLLARKLPLLATEAATFLHVVPFNGMFGFLWMLLDACQAEKRSPI